MANRSFRDIDDRYWQEYWRLKAKYLLQTKSCQELCEDLLERYLSRDSVWLDAGCGHILCHHGGEKKSRRFVGIAGVAVGLDGDLDALYNNHILRDRVAGNLGSLPFRDNSFTLLTCNMVIEHVENPMSFVREISRILQPGGIAIIHTPNIFHWEAFLACLTPHRFHRIYCWLMERREAADVFPTFYHANTFSRLKWLFHSAGMALKEGGPTVDVPKRFPIPLLSTILLLLNILEVKSLSSRLLAPFRHNLLMVFHKPGADTIRFSPGPLC